MPRPVTTSTRLEQDFDPHQISACSQYFGEVSHVFAQTVHVKGLNSQLALGEQIEIRCESGPPIHADIISLMPTHAVATTYSDTFDLQVGQAVYLSPDAAPRPSKAWIGCVLDFNARLVDGTSLPKGPTTMLLRGDPPKAILRKPLGKRLNTGIAAIDTLLPLCEGQRLGLFAGSGVGKSTLLGTFAKSSSADITIVALIGERGREVRTFVEQTLGEDGMKSSIVFVATSNDPSAVKIKTALLAMSTAEYFRNQGRSVLFLFDSLTRYAEAHRDVALSAGETPSLRAYPPSTFRALASLCERAGPGTDDMGDIAAIFSVLVAGSDMEEPIADMVRGILDGHVILDREIAERGRYPAIHIGKSVSRSLPDAATDFENTLIQQARELMSAYEDARPLIQSGLYVSGSDPVIDKAIDLHAPLENFVGTVGTDNISDTVDQLKMILEPEIQPDTQPNPQQTSQKN